MARDALMRHVQLLQRVAMLDDPSENGIEVPSHRSQSLKLAIARYLQTYPPGHPLFIDRDYTTDHSCALPGVASKDPNSCRRDPLFVQFLDFRLPQPQIEL